MLRIKPFRIVSTQNSKVNWLKQNHELPYTLQLLGCQLQWLKKNEDENLTSIQDTVRKQELKGKHCLQLSEGFWHLQQSRL